MPIGLSRCPIVCVAISITVLLSATYVVGYFALTDRVDVLPGTSIRVFRSPALAPLMRPMMWAEERLVGTKPAIVDGDRLIEPVEIQFTIDAAQVKALTGSRVELTDDAKLNVKIDKTSTPATSAP